MTRVTAGFTRRRRHKKVLKRAKGFRGARGCRYKAAVEAVIKGGGYAYRDRRQRRRDFRRLWIARINAAVRERGLTYSVFIAGLNKAGIEVNRKMLSELALNEPKAFDKIVESAQQAVG